MTHLSNLYAPTSLNIGSVFVVKTLTINHLLTFQTKSMKKLIVLILIIGCYSPDQFARNPENGRKKEVYLSGNLLTFSNFGLQYKSELKNNTCFRFGIASFYPNYYKNNTGSSSRYNTSSFNISGGLDLGIEKRTSITDKLTAFYGINFYTGTAFIRNKTEDPTLPLELRHEDSFNTNTGFGFDSGLILKLSDSFSISAEITPRLLIFYESSQNVVATHKETDKTTGGSFNLNSHSLRVSFIYNWTKQ